MSDAAEDEENMEDEQENEEDAGNVADTEEEPEEPAATTLPGAASADTTTSFFPSILPEWRNQCEDDVNLERKLEPTEEDGARYAHMSCNVGWKKRVDYALNYLETDAELDSTLLACLLECVISSVISLAAGKMPPTEYFICSIFYLNHVQNEFGENPPNIAGFIEYLKSKAPPDALIAIEDCTDPDADYVLPGPLAQVPKNLRN